MENLRRIGGFVEDKLPWSRVALIVAFLATFYPIPTDDRRVVVVTYAASVVIWILFLRMVLEVSGVDVGRLLRRFSNQFGSPEPATEETSGGLPIRRAPSPEVERQPVVREEPKVVETPTSSRPAVVGEGSGSGFRIGRGTILAVVVLIVAAIVAFWPTGGTPAAEPATGAPAQIASTEDVGVPKPPEQPVSERPVQQTWPDWKIYAGYGFVLLLVGFLIVGLMAVGGKEPPWSNFVRRLSSLRRREE